MVLMRQIAERYNKIVFVESVVLSGDQSSASIFKNYLFTNKVPYNFQTCICLRCLSANDCGIHYFVKLAIYTLVKVASKLCRTKTTDLIGHGCNNTIKYSSNSATEKYTTLEQW